MGNRICVIDPASGGKDRFTFCTAGWERGRDVRDFIRFANMGAFEPKIVRSLGGAAVMDQIIDIGLAAGADAFCMDQRDRLTTEDACRKRGVRYRVLDWTAASKPPAVERVRQWFRERSIVLSQYEALRRELLGFEERVAASGAFTYGARGNGHDDYVALLITAAMADIDGGYLLRPGQAPAGTRGAVFEYQSAFSEGPGVGATFFDDGPTPETGIASFDEGRNAGFPQQHADNRALAGYAASLGTLWPNR